MSKPKLDSHLELALASIPVFSDDGRLDLAELDRLMEVALRDRDIDEEEKRVLANILGRAEKDGVDPAVLERIQEVRRRYDLPA